MSVKLDIKIKLNQMIRDAIGKKNKKTTIKIMRTKLDINTKYDKILWDEIEKKIKKIFKTNKEQSKE